MSHQSGRSAAVITCPKCHRTSGDDWRQCEGACPIPGSPHYKPELKATYGDATTTTTSPPDSSAWSTEKIVSQFRNEVHQVFVAENRRHLEEEAAEIAHTKIEHADYLAAHPETDLTIRDSLFWEIYRRSMFHIDGNHVKIVLPTGFGLYSELIEMFGTTSVGWTRPSISAETVDNESRVVIDLLLVDYWNDDKAQQHARDPVPKTSTFLQNNVKQVRELRQALVTWWTGTLILRPHPQLADPDSIRPAPIVLAEHTLWICNDVERRLTELPENLPQDRLHVCLRDINRNIGYIQSALWQLGTLSLRSLGFFGQSQAKIPESLQIAESQMGPRDGDVVDHNGRIIGGMWEGGLARRRRERLMAVPRPKRMQIFVELGLLTEDDKERTDDEIVRVAMERAFDQKCIQRLEQLIDHHLGG